MSDHPSRKLKLLFWVLLGLYSVALVEVPTGSQMFPFFTPWGLLIVVPLYLLHTVVLATVVFRFGRPRFWVLYAAGMIFGLYEAYITKVLWTSFMPEGPPIRFGGVAVIETAILVLIVHPLQAFVLPVLLAETALTSSRDVFDGLPERLKRALRRHGLRWLLLLMVFLGITQQFNSPSPATSLASGAGTTAVLLAATALFRRTGGHHLPMRALLPQAKGLAVFLTLLLLFYVLFGVAMKPEAIPGLRGQLTVWVMYAICGVIFVRALRQSRLDPEVVAEPPVRRPVLALLLAGGTFTLATTAARVGLHGLSAPITMALLLTYLAVGVVLLALTVRYATLPLPSAWRPAENSALDAT